jgi:hypothetical protein
LTRRAALSRSPDWSEAARRIHQQRTSANRSRRVSMPPACSKKRPVPRTPVARSLTRSFREHPEISDLRPTQASVGKAEVRIKAELKNEIQRRSERDFLKYLLKHDKEEPIIIGPGGICAFQDPREIKTKFRKSIETTFLPVGEDIVAIVRDWVRYLMNEKLFGPNDLEWRRGCPHLIIDKTRFSLTTLSLAQTYYTIRRGPIP